MVAAGLDEGRCQNCGALAPERFCPQCGQTTRLHPPSVREFLHEFIGHHVALEGRLAVTLRTLVLSPGKLAADFFAGRRERYIAPLRLYLTFSVVFFVALGFVGDGNGVAVRTDRAALPEDAKVGVVIASDAEHDADFAQLREQLAHLGVAQSPAGRLAVARLKRFAALSPAEQSERLSQKLQHYGPYLVFCMVPVLAVWSLLAYWSRHRFYAEHLVQALHVHTVLLMLMTISLVPWDVGPALAVVLFVYVTLAYRRVFGGRLVPTLGRVAFMGVGYGASFLCAFIALVVISLLT